MFLISLVALAQAGTASVPVARGPARSFINALDYPAGVAPSAARAVEVALVVGPDGRVASCTILGSSGTSLLDATTCRLLRSRMRFTPARDAAGNPTAGEVRETIDWAAIRSGTSPSSEARPPLVRTEAPPIITLPVAPPADNREWAARARADLGSLITADDYPVDARRAGVQGTTGFRLDVGPDGSVTRCTVTQSSGSEALDTASCRLMSARARFTPARDMKGRAVADTVNNRIAWRLPPQNNIVPDLVITHFTIGTDGAPRDCSRFAELSGRTAENKAPDCGPSPPAGTLLEALRGIANKRETRFRIEARLLRDAAKPWPVLEQEGRKIIGYDLIRLRVAPGGRVIGCVVLDRQTGGLPQNNICRNALQIQDYKETGEAEMRMVVFTAIESQA